MRIGTFYNVILYALQNGEIKSVEEGVRSFAEAGVCYYEVFDDNIPTVKEEDIMMAALTKYGCRVGNLYFKKNIFNTDRKSIDELMSFTVEKLEQCVRLRCKKLMPVIALCGDNPDDMDNLREYYRKVSEISGEYNVKTVFENGTNKKSGTMTMDDVDALLNDSDKLNYLLDTGNFWFSNENTSDAIARFTDRISRVHLKDILPEKQEIQQNGRGLLHYTTLGNGISFTRESISQLMKSGYDKGFTIEIGYSNPILPELFASIEMVKKAASSLQLAATAKQYHDVLFTYAKQYEQFGEEIELKTMHMLSVASLMNDLAIRFSLSPQMHKLAIITGLFHDIGRYEQFKTYHTFRDIISVDHGDLSAELIEKNQFLSELSCEEQNMVVTAIRNHNKYEIDGDVKGDTLTLCRMIRDADKIDCFRVVCNEPFENSYGVSRKDIEDSPISDRVYESIMNHKMVVNTDRKYPIDFILSCVAFVFDIYYPQSRAITKEQKKYLCLLDTLDYTNEQTKLRTKTIFNEIDDYLK